MGDGMTDDRAASRASHLLPEELPVEPGADPQSQASALLAESDERTARAERPVDADPTIEHRTAPDSAT
jgi:hypothetical protein